MPTFSIFSVVRGYHVYKGSGKQTLNCASKSHDPYAIAVWPSIELLQICISHEKTKIYHARKFYVYDIQKVFITRN